MALQVWITGIDGMKNEGLGGSRNLGNSTSDANGKIGICLKITSNYVSDYTMTPDTSDITMCGWFKFNLAELQAALSSGYTSSATTPTGSLLGYNSYGGLGLQYETNDQYSSSGVINQINVFGAFRDANASATTIKTTIPFDTWIHIGLTWNHITKQAIIYINGVLINAVTRTSATSIGAKIFGINTGTVSGGNGPGKKITFYFNDIRCYDNLLSEDEIHELSLGKIGHWCLDENSFITKNTAANHINFSNISNYESGYTSISDCEIGGKKIVITNKLSWCGAVLSVPITETGTYTLSVYCKPISRSSTAINLTLYFSGCGYSDNSTAASWSNPGTWQRISLVRNFQQTGTLTIHLICYGGSRNSNYTISAEYCKLLVEKMPEPSNYSLTNTAPIFKDISGNHYDLTVNGNPTLSNDSARYDRSTLFDGNNYLSCTSPTAEAKTLSLWAYVESIPASAVLFADYKSKLALGFYNSGTLLITRCGTSATLGTISSLVNTNAWNHFCVVNGATNQLYINGLAAIMSGSSNWTHSTDTLMIGRRSASSNGFTNKISDVRLYATALSADDVLKLYKLGNV